MVWPEHGWSEPSLTADRHRHLRLLAQSSYRFPGVRAATRWVVLFLLKRLRLSGRIGEHLFSFFARDVAPNGIAVAGIQTPFRKPIRAEIDPSDWLCLHWYLQEYRGYEPGTVRLFCRLLETKTRLLEVGANIGYYTLLAARQLEDRGEVHSFEPFPPSFQRLSSNVRLNGFRCVHLNQSAVSNFDGKAPLFLPQDGSLLTPSLLEGFTQQKGHLDVQVTRLDTYCKEKDLRQVDLVKIDAEGRTLAILQGMGTLLLESKPDLIIEVLPGEELSLNNLVSGSRYKKFLITSSGLEEHAVLASHPKFKDYYLRWEPS